MDDEQNKENSNEISETLGQIRNEIEEIEEMQKSLYELALRMNELEQIEETKNTLDQKL